MGRMTRKEKCWQCDRRRSDVTLRMCDDRLCQDSDNVNRAVSEGRVSGSADKSSVTDTVTVSDGTTTGITNHAVSDTESANTTTSMPKPLIRNMIRNELLCYVFNKMDLVVHDSLVKVCTGFYTAAMLSLTVGLGINDDKGLAKTRPTWKTFFLPYIGAPISLSLWQVTSLACLPLA